MAEPSCQAPITENDAFLEEVLEHASVPTLMMTLVHLTGDASLLDGPIRPRRTPPGVADGGLSEDDKATVRAMA
jgi:4-hydroxyacetophenone monooxygenase